jgi:hypothetical protein
MTPEQLAEEARKLLEKVRDEYVTTRVIEKGYDYAHQDWTVPDLDIEAALPLLTALLQRVAEEAREEAEKELAVLKRQRDDYWGMEGGAEE